MRRSIAVLALAAAACGPGGELSPLRVGDPLPEYGARTMTGDSVTLSGTGEPLLVNVWATWCAPCRDEMPELQELAARYDDLRVVGVSIDRPGAEAQIARFLRDLGVGFEILLDPQERIVRRFTTVGVPETFLVDGDGVVRMRWTGRFHPLDVTTTTLIEEVLDHRGPDAP